MQRERRQNLILSLISTGGIRSQEGLRAALAQKGVEVTQATLSRDLRELGVRKGPDGWEAPGQAAGQPSVGQRVLRQFVRSVNAGGTIVVLKTGPGQAQVVALELDRAPPAGAIGTLAGDDTVFLACEAPARASALCDEFREIVGEPSAREGVA